MINQDEFKKYQDSFRERFPVGGFQNEDYITYQRTDREALTEIFERELSERIKNLPEEKVLRLELARGIFKLFRRKLPSGYPQDYLIHWDYGLLTDLENNQKVEFVKQLSQFLYGGESLEKRVDNFFDFLRTLSYRNGSECSPARARVIYSFFLYLSNPKEHICVQHTMFKKVLRLLKNKEFPKGEEAYKLVGYKTVIDFMNEMKTELENADWKPSGRDIDLIDVRQFLWIHYSKNKNQKDSDVENLTETKQSSIVEKKEMKDIPLNQILYGPPGTGKTYQTVNRAVEILDSNFNSKNREAIKARFDELCQEGRIKQVTFHQSFSYEDFVEGLKAETEDGKISYYIEDGVFKRICLRGQSNVEKSSDIEVDATSGTVWKMSLGNTLADEDFIYEHCIKNDEIRLGYGRDIDFSECDNWQSVKEKLKGRYDESEDYEVGVVNRFKNEMKPKDFVVVSEGNRKFRAIGQVVGEYSYEPLETRGDFAQTRSMTWLRVWDASLSSDELISKSFSQQTLYQLGEKVIDRSKLAERLEDTRTLVSATTSTRGDSKQVLIIDEINRGNISSIFGELITLIEPDKRKGNNEELEVILPYSKRPFTVPNNLYIIGTMNTADRSLALLDTALRRRFEFEEVPPDPRLLDEETEEVEGVDISQLLETMNKRIEALYNRDHLLGHSFFMGLDNNSTIADLRRIFERHVLPTLEEYFFEDWGKIRKVLGDHLKKEQKQQFIIPRFEEGELKRLLGDDHESEDEERHFRRNESALDDPAAYIGIYAPE